MTDFLVNIAAVLESKPVITAWQISELKTYIATSRPGISKQGAAALLAEAIKQVIGYRLQAWPVRKQVQIKNLLLQTAVKKPSFEITLADVLETCLRLQYASNGHAAELAAWVSQNIGRTVPAAKIYELATYYQNKNDLQSKRRLREVAAEIEERQGKAFIPILNEAVIRGKSGLCQSDPQKRRYNSNSIAQITKLIDEKTKEKPDALFLKEIEPLSNPAALKRPNRYLVNFGAAIFVLVLFLVGGGIYQSNRNNNTVNAADYNSQTVSVSPPILTPVVEEEPVSEKPQSKPRKMLMRATAYDLSVESCGKTSTDPQYGITFSGAPAKAGRTIAADPRVIPIGSKVYIYFPAPYQFLNGIYRVEDTGNLVKGNQVDIFFGADQPGENFIHNKARQFGVRQVEICLLNN